MNSTCELGDDAARALKPYPAYKESGVQWLGDVPEHWEVVRLRNTSDMRVSNVDKYAKDDEQPVRLCNYVDVYKNDRIRSGMAFMRATATTDEIERFRLQSGDVLITKDSEAWNDIGVPALVEDTQADIVSGYHLALLRPFPERVDGGYLFRALQSPAVAYQFHVEANGVTRYGLSHNAIRSVWLPLPPLSEQAAIVRFLDHADRRIRRYIRAKEKLIALLEEQKQAIIHQAVTGQIDVRTGRRYAAYRPAGVEWLGEVPRQWTHTRLKVVLSRPIHNGIFKKKDQFGAGAPLINVGDVYGDHFRVEPASLERVQASADELRRFQVQPGDIFFVRSSLKLEGTGRSAIAPDCSSDTVFECHLVQARPDSGRINPRYLVFQLNSYAHRHHLISRANVVTMATVAQGTISSCPVVTPPRREQDRIVEWIDAQWSRHNQLVEGASRDISLLREHRVRLIADGVTGKLDLREEAAGLSAMNPRVSEGDAGGGVDQGAGSAEYGWRHSVEEGGASAVVADAERSETRAVSAVSDVSRRPAAKQEMQSDEVT